MIVLLLIFNAVVITCTDCLVGIGTGYGLDDQRVGDRVPVGKEFLLLMSSRPILGPTQLPIQ
jgi:hypothetical protein